MSLGDLGMRGMNLEGERCGVIWWGTEEREIGLIAPAIVVQAYIAHFDL